MLKPIKAYKRSQEIQLNWIRNHPVQYIALNAILLGVGIGYVEWKDRRDERKHVEDIQSRIDAWNEEN